MIFTIHFGVPLFLETPRLYPRPPSWWLHLVPDSKLSSSNMAYHQPKGFFITSPITWRLWRLKAPHQTTMVFSESPSIGINTKILHFSFTLKKVIECWMACGMTPRKQSLISPFWAILAISRLSSTWKLQNYIVCFCSLEHAHMLRLGVFNFEEFVGWRHISGQTCFSY